jgi:uncharacterized protein with LGFP repeats
VSTLEALQAVGARPVAAPAWSQRAADAVTGWLSRRTSRRGFLQKSAVVGSALAVDTLGFALKPQSAYASVCGPGSTCSSGWTVFCATINKGANSCPPGSIAAGWWKADGASLCGGKARYIIDCNATCSRCSTAGRAGICARSCWSCGCTCGPAGQCDNRRVCCNGFRYGQCNQQVRQVGGVVCRVVSCIPPWKFEKCSTASATDNATRDHSSPALPAAWSALTARYWQLGGAGSVLGPTVYGEVAVPGGRAQRTIEGRMSWSAKTGARYTAGPAARRYHVLGNEAGVLGFPLGDPVASPGGKGRRQHFQHGALVYHPSLGAFEVLGALAARYRAAGMEAGVLGYPVASPVAGPDGEGRASAFQRGRISWHPALGAARLIGGTIAARYVQLGAEAGKLGYPVADEVVVGSAKAVSFQHGRIVASSATGVFVLYGGLATAYVRSGAESGPLGLPTAEEQAVTGGLVQTTQHGRLSHPDGAGAFFCRGPIAARYVELEAEQGRLGWPTTDEYRPADGVRRNDFQLGWISYDEATGAVTVG